MDKRILIVHPNSDMILAIINLLHEIRSQGYRLSEKCAKTAMEAEQSFHAAEPVDLLITGVEIPEGTKASEGPGEQCRRGLELVRRFRALSPRMATILVFAGQVDNDLYAFTQSEGRCRLVVEGQGFQEHLTNAIIKYVRPHQPEAPRRVYLEINLFTKPGYSYYQFQPEGQPPRKLHPLKVKTSVLKELVAESLGVHIDNPAWKKELKQLGEHLADTLFESTPGNNEFFEELMKWNT